MRPFEVEGSKYIRINGKSFFLLRAYTIRYDKFIFVQVFGRGALTKDDLPEKNWEITVTKGPEGKVYTAWKPGYFDGSNETQLCAGATQEASLRLLLSRYAPDVDVSRALASAVETVGHNKGHIRYQTGITTYDDAGSSGVPAYGVERMYAFNDWIASLTKEEPCPTL